LNVIVKSNGGGFSLIPLILGDICGKD